MFSLSQRIVGGAAAVFLAAFVVFLAYDFVVLFPAFDRMLEDRSKAEAEHIARHLSSRISPDHDGINKGSFREDRLREAAEHFHLAKLKVFSPAGETLFSTDPADVGYVNRESYFRRVVSNGASFVKFVNRSETTAEGQTLGVDLIEVYVPIQRAGAVAGVFEIYYDITDDVDGLRATIGRFRATLGGLAAVLVLGAALTVRKGGSMVRRLEGTERALKAEKELAEGERGKFEAIVAAIGDGISIQDRDFRVVYQNDVHRRLAGGDKRGQYCYVAYSRSETVCTGCPVAAAFEDGGIHVLEKTMGEGKDERFIEIKSSVVRDGNGEIAAVIEAVRDITRRKRAEQELALQRDRLENTVAERTRELRRTNTLLAEEVRKRAAAQEALEQALRRVGEEKAKSEAIVEALADGVAINDREFRIVYQNKAHQAFVGGDFQGRRCYEAYHGRDRICDECALRDAFADGRSHAVERTVMRDGTETVVEVISSPMQNAEGDVTAGIQVFRDITERKRAERERKRLTEELHHAQKMEAVGRLAGGIAHDFNNILTGIKGYAGLALMRPELDKTILRYVKKIETSAERAAALTQNLLAFSRKEKPRPRRVDLNAVVRSACELLGPLGDTIIVSVNLFPGELWVYADPGLLELVVVNLATNARDAMPDGGTLTVETSRRAAGVHGEDGAIAVVTVRDTGPGVDPAVKSMIFDPFFTTKDKGRGTGLGLSTAYGIVKHHGGRIEIDDTDGEGAAFRVILPVVEEPDWDGTVSLEDDAELLRGGEETILLAEDDAELRAMIKEVLQEQGYRVLAAEDGRRVAEIFRTHGDKVDLLLFDIMMPGQNGLQAYRAIAEAGPAPPVVFMSGYFDDGINRGEILKEGYRFLAKPAGPPEILRIVRSALDA